MDHSLSACLRQSIRAQLCFTLKRLRRQNIKALVLRGSIPLCTLARSVKLSFLLKVTSIVSMSVSELTVEHSVTREEGSEIEAAVIHAKDRSSNQREQWIKEQDLLKRSLVLHDDFSWRLVPTPLDNQGLSATSSSGIVDLHRLRYIGGVDLSFSKQDTLLACGALVVMELDTMQVVYEDFAIVHLTMPYITGFLAFRETPVLLGLVKKMALLEPTLYPQLLMVDGNGILHPRGFGLASHLGVLANMPTIGIGKNLLHIDGLTSLEVRHVASESSLQAGDSVPLIGSTGQVWGVALRSHEGCQKPVFVSVGHRISLDTAVAVVRRCCVHRIPEPVRQADLRSRKHLRIRVPQ